MLINMVFNMKKSILFETPDHRARRFLYIGIAKAFKSNPKEFRRIGLERLAFIAPNMSRIFSDKWFELLTTASDQEIIQVLVKKHDPYESLRQTCPMIFAMQKIDLIERRARWKKIKLTKRLRDIE